MSSAPRARSFKLRFAASREPGRSNVSVSRPLSLPSIVTDKFYSAAGAGAAASEDDERALLRVTAALQRGPRDRLPAPATTTHQYGWWGSRAALDPRLDHRIRDSSWLKERLRVLASDHK